MDQMARDRFKAQLERKSAGAAGADAAVGAGGRSGWCCRLRRTGQAGHAGDGGAAAMTLIPIIELCKYSPGMVTALGVSMGLTANGSCCAGPSRRRSAGRCRCSRSTRLARGPSPSRARGRTRSAR